MLQKYVEDVHEITIPKGNPSKYDIQGENRVSSKGRRNLGGGRHWPPASPSFWQTISHYSNQGGGGDYKAMYFIALENGSLHYYSPPPNYLNLPTALLPISAVVTPLWISKEHENNEAFIERVQFC